MSTHKLIYFNLNAKAETARMLFQLANQKFEDVRINSEDWPQMKPTTPFGQLPVLEINGVSYCQSRAIERLLAKRFGFYGQTDLEQTKADMVVDCVDDVRRPLVDIMITKDNTVKEELIKKYKEDQFPTWAHRLENFINEQGYFVGNKISWPDIACFNMLEFAHQMADTSSLMKDVAKLQKLMEVVQSQPDIAKWIAERPKVHH